MTEKDKYEKHISKFDSPYGCNTSDVLCDELHKKHLYPPHCAKKRAYLHSLGILLSLGWHYLSLKTTLIDDLWPHTSHIIYCAPCCIQILSSNLTHS